MFKPTAEGVAATFNSEFKNQLRITLDHMGGTSNYRTVYRPATEERVADAVVAARVRAENARIERENRIREQEESSERFAAAFNTVVQGTASALAESNAQQERQRAALDEAALRARAIADYRAQQQRAQQEEDKRREQQAGREALARQLVAGIAYRDQQAAKTSDPAARARWQAENAQAMREAERMGMGAQVGERVKIDRQVNAATQAEAARQAQAVQEAQLQAKQRRAAAERAEQQRIASEQAAAERARQVEHRRRAEERARERTQQEWQQQLQRVRAGLRLSATTCPGGGGRYFIVGPKTSAPNCVTVHYEARCPSVPAGAGVRGSRYNYVGASCLGLGEAIEIPGSPLGCPAAQVRVEIKDVTGCS